MCYNGHTTLSILTIKPFYPEVGYAEETRITDRAADAGYHVPDPGGHLRAEQSQTGSEERPACIPPELNLGKSITIANNSNYNNIAV